MYTNVCIKIYTGKKMCLDQIMIQNSDQNCEIKIYCFNTGKKGKETFAILLTNQ